MNIHLRFLPKLLSQQFRYLYLLSGVIASLLLYLINPFGVSEEASTVLAIAALMIIWWVTEALPMPVVALLPLIFFPLLNISKINETAISYSNPVIFLFMGGFMLALAIEKWRLHQRIALNIIQIMGTSGNRIILGFILSTGLLSMWLSNTATTMMMFPIALSVITVMTENHRGKGNIDNFSIAMMLVIAYASNIGGIATIIGTPPNVAYVGFIKENYHITIGFINWMMICTPLALLLLACLYVVIVKFLFPNRIQSDLSMQAFIFEKRSKLGPLSTSEKRVMVIFAGAVFLWFTRGFLNDLQHFFILDDTIIALMCATALFITPSGATGDNKTEGNENKDDPRKGASKTLLEWQDTSKMAWGILLLIGGGIALGSALEKVGLMEQLGHWFAQFGETGFILVLLVTFFSIFISEFMSNTAQVIIMAPVVSSLADSIGINPLLLGIPMTLAASCANMMPMGTPPNAIVFATGHLKLRHMMKAGFVMNIISVIFISLFSWFLLPSIIKP